jgi:predicted Zn-dependent peptidase
MLVKLIKEPYFTDENVEKEQGIIGQEINMYDDDPNFTVYFNALRAMYKNHPIRIDIAGTIESISHITKELLYTCYNTFYSPQNMFFIVVGDVDVEETIDLIEKNINKYENKVLSKNEIQKFVIDEAKEINKKEIVKKMDIYMPLICVGYKLDVVNEYENLKRQIICEIISDLYFSKISDFYEKEYKQGIISDEISFDYEGTDNFSHVIISSSSVKIDKLKQDLLEYLEEIKEKEIDEIKFKLIKKKKIGYTEFSADNLNSSYRRIIEHALYGEEMYSDIKILNEITPNDIKEFLNILFKEKQVISIVKEK